MSEKANQKNRITTHNIKTIPKKIGCMLRTFVNKKDVSKKTNKNKKDVSKKTNKNKKDICGSPKYTNTQLVEKNYSEEKNYEFYMGRSCSIRDSQTDGCLNEHSSTILKYMRSMNRSSAV